MPGSLPIPLIEQKHFRIRPFNDQLERLLLSTSTYSLSFFGRNLSGFVQSMADKGCIHVSAPFHVVDEVAAISVTRTQVLFFVIAENKIFMVISVNASWTYGSCLLPLL